MNAWFDDFAARLAAAARQRGADVQPQPLDSGVAAELLELARATAHTQERRFAPLATFLAGLTAGRAGLPAGEAAAMIREVREALEREAPPAAG